jgi:hypothetical protein
MLSIMATRDHCSIYKNPASTRILMSVHNFTSCLPNIHMNTVILSTARSPAWFFHSDFQAQVLMHSSFLGVRFVSRSSRLAAFARPEDGLWGVLLNEPPRYTSLLPCRHILTPGPNTNSSLTADGVMKRHFCTSIWKGSCSLCNVDRHCGLVVRVPGYITEMYCDSCEVRTEFIYAM